VVGYAATELLLVPLADLHPQEILSYGGTASDGSTGGDIFAPHAYKSYDLLPPHMTCHTARDGAADVLQIFALARAFYVTAEAFVPGGSTATRSTSGLDIRPHLRLPRPIPGRHQSLRWASCTAPHIFPEEMR
jgi:hypothetical protein